MKLASLALLLPLAAGCTDSGSDATARTAPPGACGAVETHVVGIYDSKGEVVEVKLDRPGKHNLVLSAHAATRWKVSTTNGAQLLSVYAVGYYEQKVAVPYGTKVIKDSHELTGTYACGFSEGKSDGCDSDQLLTLAGKIVHHISSFHGCRDATKWTIGNDLSTSSNCSAAPASVQYDTIAGCIAFMEGETSCGSGPGDGSGTTEPGGGSGSGSGSGSDGSGDPGPVFL